MIASRLALGESQFTQLVRRPLLLATLITAFFTGIVAILRAFDREAPAALLLGFLFLVALESILTSEWLASSDRRMTSSTLYRLAELVALAISARIVAWIGYGGWPELAQARSLLLEPGLIFDVPYVGILSLAIIAWAQGATYADHFIQLRLRESELDFFRKPPSSRDAALNDRPIDIDRSRYVARFMRGWVSGGVFLVMCAAISASDLGALQQQTIFGRSFWQNVGGLGLAPEALVGILVYFLLGFWLLSQARLAAMRSRWITDNIPATAPVANNWRRYSLRTLLIAALIAAFIPIGSTVTIGRLLEVAVLLVLSFINLAVLLFVLLLSLLLAPFGGGDSVEEPAAPLITLPEQSIEPVAATPMSETTALVLGSLFWIVVLVAVIVALHFFLRERGYRIEQLRLGNWWTAVLAWWRTLWRGVERQVRRASEAVIGRRASTGPREARRPFRFLRVNALPPRDQVRYYYLSTVRRAGDRGAERGPGETPLEFERVLQEKWPESESDIAELTNAFLAARYSIADILPDRLTRVKATWRRVRAALRRRSG